MLIDIKHKTNGAILHQIDARRPRQGELGGTLLVLRGHVRIEMPVRLAMLPTGGFLRRGFSFSNLASADLSHARLVARESQLLDADFSLAGQLRPERGEFAAGEHVSGRPARSPMDRVLLLGADLSGVDLTAPI